MKGLVIIADGFEDTEAIATIDVLKRSKLEITTPVSILWRSRPHST